MMHELSTYHTDDADLWPKTRNTRHDEIVVAPKVEIVVPKKTEHSLVRTNTRVTHQIEIVSVNEKNDPHMRRKRWG